MFPANSSLPAKADVVAGHERLVSMLYGAVKSAPAALEFAGRVAFRAVIADTIRTKLNPSPAEITEVMGDIARLLDASITDVDMPAKPVLVMDLSKIDFEALRSRFKESKHKYTDLGSAQVRHPHPTGKVGTTRRNVCSRREVSAGFAAGAELGRAWRD